MTGIAPTELDDADLEREIRHLHQTRSQLLFEGCASSLTAHTERMLGLEAEYLRRHLERAAPNPLRFRDTGRAHSVPA